MTHRKHVLYISSVLILSLGGCANTPDILTDMYNSRPSFVEENDGREITNAAAKEVNAHHFVEIEFSQSSTVLSNSALKSIEAVLAQAEQSGEVTQVIVLSWADEEYPSEVRHKLSQKQGALADKRNLAIRKYLNSISRTDVATYNMAKQPSAFSRWFNTTDSKLKNSLITAGLPTTGDELQYPSKASHAVILVKTEPGF